MKGKLVSQRAITSALSQAAKILGHPPYEAEYTKLRRTKFASWPHAVTIVSHFQSWSTALEAAGLSVPDKDGRSKFDKASIVTALKKYAGILGEPPSFTQTRRDSRHIEWLPEPQTVVYHFGSWRAALEAANLPVKKVGGFGAW